MSEDPTQNLERQYGTNPTILTVLERLDDFRSAVDKRFDALESRIDRMDGLLHATRGELLELRAEFRDFRAEVRERLRQPA